MIGEMLESFKLVDSILTKYELLGAEGLSQG